MENNKNPNIRFKGFTDPWEQRKLGDISESYSGGTPTADKKEYYNGDIPFIRSGEISGDKTELFITDEGLNNSSAKMVQIGYILYALYGATSGEVSISKLKGAINQAVLAIQPHQNYDSQFLMQWLRKSKDNIIGTYLQGGQGNLSGNIVKELIVDVPTYEEQKGIGEYFSNLDNLITLHQRKYNKLLNVKKSMLEKMFPKNGSNIPEIRFKGFTDPWEQRKFTDITFLSGEKNKDNLPYESYSVTNENGFVPQNEQFENGGTMATADKRMYYIVSKNSFAYNPARINVGSIGYYDGPENVIVSSLYEVFKTSEDIDDRYLWHWFKSNNFKKLIEQYQEGGVRLYFYYDKLCMCSLPTPSIQEQIKIGRYFDNLDNLITLHQRELEKLQNIKKSMLEKMFV